MPLSDKDIEELKGQLRKELEEEHIERERRALVKADRRGKRSSSSLSGRNKETDTLKAQIRKDFYIEHGYEEKLDQTGRSFYLSPTEIENKMRKKRSKNQKSRQSQKQLDKWSVYFFVAGLGVVTAYLMVRSL